MYGALFPIVNPLVAAPVFAALTGERTRRDRFRVALWAAVFTAAILAVFLIAGEPLLHRFGISIEALQIAGGIVIGLTGLQMVRGGSAGSGPDAPEAAALTALAFSPLAIPLLAGPGAMSTEMAIEARTNSFADLSWYLLAIALIGLTCFAVLAFAGRICEWIGKSGFEAIERVLGLLVLAIGVEMIVYGIAHHPVLR
jgi:multiple antibiotic resistance protein